MATFIVESVSLYTPEGMSKPVAHAISKDGHQYMTHFDIDAVQVGGRYRLSGKINSLGFQTFYAKDKGSE